MYCKTCGKEINSSNSYLSDSRFCLSCGTKRAEFITYRKETLKSLRQMNLNSKIIQTKYLIKQAVNEFGIEHVYISYSGGKDSTVLSHIAKQIYPNILHLFANTTNEYPETLQHVKWEAEKNGTNLITVIPIDSSGKVWTFKRVVEYYGYPIFSKRIANAIRTYQHALSKTTKQHSIDYINRNFQKYIKYIELPISDKCCDKLKKEPLRKTARKLGLECAILGILAPESYQREKDWLKYGCNVFHERKENQSRPLSFWANEDINEYIRIYNVKISKLYNMGYSRNGCMYCGFGIQMESGKNRFQRLSETHPIQYSYFVENFSDLVLNFDIQIV